MMRSTVTGLSDLDRALDAVGARAQRGADRGLDEGAEALADDMRQRSPSATGHLRSRIGARTEADGSRVVGPADVDYDFFVEFGTSDTPAQPYATPAAEQERQRLPGRIEQSVRGELP